MLRRAGKDTPEVFTTRWAMSYLRGSMTRDRIQEVSGAPPAAGTTAAVVYRLPDGPIKNKTFWTQVERDIRDQITRTLTLGLPANVGLKLYGRPGEDPDAFEARCLKVADAKADEEIAKLRDEYESKATTLRDKIAAPHRPGRRPRNRTRRQRDRNRHQMDRGGQRDHDPHRRPKKDRRQCRPTRPGSVARMIAGRRRSPIGRGTGFRCLSVRVRVPPSALT
jgi:hypothetical protein